MVSVDFFCLLSLVVDSEELDEDLVLGFEVYSLMYDLDLERRER